MNILESQLKAQQQNRAYALVTIVKTEGATPRGVGSKMLVFADGSIEGSIGGGVLEKHVAADAAECVRTQTKALHEYENRASADDSPCGGLITVFIEPEKGALELVVCGVGHVGKSVIQLASALGYRITAVDTRDTELTTENAKLADRFVLVDEFYGGIKALDIPPQAFFLVSTYSHQSDLEALAATLEKDAAYVGMLGSAIKIKTLFGKLRERGYADVLLDQVHTPIGLDIGGETPPEIALSILAEMQMVRYGGTGGPIKHSNK